jgi:cytochrome c5
MKNKPMCFLLAAILVSAVLVGCGAKPAPDPGKEEEAGDVNAPTPAPLPAPQAAAATDPAELFKQSCSVCHKIEKVVAYHDETPWKDLVDRMIQHGAKITPENAAIIVKHLETTYPLKTPQT